MKFFDDKFLQDPILTMLEENAATSSLEDMDAIAGVRRIS